MSLTFYEYPIEIEFEKNTLLHIGYSLINESWNQKIKRDLHQTVQAIPGTTIRGAIASEYMKLYCNKNIKDCFVCNEKCFFYWAFVNWEHGNGLYWRYVKVQGELVKTPHIKINRNSKSAERHFLYYYYGLRVDKIKSKLISTKKLEREEYSKLAVATSSITHIGGRTSWGWGMVRNMKIGAPSSHKIEAISSSDFIVNTPLPISNLVANFKESINKSIEDLSKGFGLISKLEIKVKSFKPILIGSWDQVNNDRRLVFALDKGSKVMLKPRNSDSEMLLGLAEYLGLTDSGTWYTKSGYGRLCSTQ